ncbi:STAS domain-containing protein [Mycolicibacterium hodleri]|uniref:Anti-sigma factor antagonist n=1 Tax=Mycolicibacterium hodleri TaxID=49897 RepID=A0A502EH06_9MYCO|nr:STAS domain-containing protein [Mycolicibacterium hodleri]TPG35776.1 anti-sigma factor antagonist [Mycolicibacterium hodleri]
MSPADAISTSVELREGITVLSLDGVVDLATSPTLEQQLTELMDDGPAALIMDLTAVTFLASVGLRILAETHERIGGNGKFAVVASGPITARPIQLTKLDEFLALYPTVDDAVMALGAH